MTPVAVECCIARLMSCTPGQVRSSPLHVRAWCLSSLRAPVGRKKQPRLSTLYSTRLPGFHPGGTPPTRTLKYNAAPSTGRERARARLGSCSLHRVHSHPARRFQHVAPTIASCTRVPLGRAALPSCLCLLPAPLATGQRTGKAEGNITNETKRRGFHTAI